MRQSIKAWVFAGGLMVILSTPILGLAQEAEEPEMSASGLLTEAGRMLAIEDYLGAEPLLIEYISRMEKADDPRVEAMLQDMRFKLGKIRINFQDYPGAVVYFEEYLSKKPVYRRLEALKSLAISYYEMKDYDSAISTVLTAFAPPPVVEEVVVSEAEKIEKLDDEQLGGISKRKLRRYEEQAEDVDNSMFTELSSDRPPEEAEYTLADRVLLNMTLAESYSAKFQWKESIDPYQFVIDHTKKMQRRGYAVMKQVSALIELDEFDRVRTLVGELAQTDAKYDIRINMAMMNAASSLYNRAEYDSSLQLYRMILPRQVLADFMLLKVNELRDSVGLSPTVITISTNEAGRVETMLGSAISDGMRESTSVIPETPIGGILPPELMELEESISKLMSLPPYEMDVVYRVGQLYASAGRPWEALASFDRVVAYDKDGEMGTVAFCDALMVLSDLKLYARIESRAMTYLADHKSGLAPRQVAYYLTAAYQMQEKMKEIKALRPLIAAFEPSDNVIVLQYESELYYMQAIADLMLLNYKEAKDGFEQVLVNYPGSPQEENLRYWHAMTQIFLQQYSDAYEEFEDYLGKFPQGAWCSSVWFQEGICQFALENYEEAEKRFQHVIDTYPQSMVYPDACSMRGDLLASRALLDEAILDYKEALRTAKKPLQATYAVFQMAGVYEVLVEYDKIVALVNTYLADYGEEADVAKAAYWIGKTKMAQGKVDEAIAAYRDTIIGYGGNVRQDGVDLIIAELLRVTRRLSEGELKQLRADLGAALNNTDNVTLQLRLRVTIAEMDGTTEALGQELLADLDDLSMAPPPVLSLICDASFAQQDYSRSEEMLALFLNHFEDSAYMRSAYKLRAYDLYSQDLQDEAMKFVQDAQSLYGTDDDMAWAMIMRGRLELKAGDYDAARATLRSVLTVRGWRGEAYAEATYYLGEVDEQAGEPKKAFGWYQRAYSLYKGHADGYWAAESYLASARCLEKLGLDGDMRNTYRAMLYDKYINTLPQADVAREKLGPLQVQKIKDFMATGGVSNITISVESGETSK